MLIHYNISTDIAQHYGECELNQAAKPVDLSWFLVQPGWKGWKLWM